MKADISKTIFIIILCAYFIAGCSDNESPEQMIIGKWTTVEFQAGILVEGVPVIHWYMEKHEATEAEAIDFANTIISEVENNLKGTMEFNKNHTYNINFGEESEEIGTWMLVDENKKLSFTNSKNNESNESDIKALSSTTLILAFSDTSRGDVDQDRRNEDLFISIELTLKK